MYAHGGNPDGIFLYPGQYVVFADGQTITFEQSDFNLLFERYRGEDPRRSFSIELRDLLKEFQDNPSLFQDETEKHEYIRTKRRKILPAVKEWVKDTKPSQFFAVWNSETDFYHTDSVEIFYTKEEEQK